MYKPTIVIVDSGVEVKHPMLMKDTINEIVWNNGFNKQRSYGHGTAIYGIIRSCLEFAEIFAHYKLL